MLYNGIHSICKGKNDVLQSVILLRPDLTDVNKRDLVQQLRSPCPTVEEYKECQ